MKVIFFLFSSFFLCEKESVFIVFFTLSHDVRLGFLNGAGGNSNGNGRAVQGGGQDSRSSGNVLIYVITAYTT